MKRVLSVIGIASVLILVLGATAFAARAPQQGTRQAGSTPVPTASTGAANTNRQSGVQQQGNSVCCGTYSGQGGRGMGMIGGGMMRGGMMGGGTGTMQGQMGVTGDDMISMMAGVSPMHDDVEKLLGMNHQDLYNQMAAGNSLVQIAATKGVTETQLIDGIMAGRKAVFDQAVTAGRMTMDQADAMLQYMQNNIKTMINTPGTSFGLNAGMRWNTQPSQPGQAGQQNQSGQIGSAASGSTNPMGLRFGQSRMHQ